MSSGQSKIADRRMPESPEGSDRAWTDEEKVEWLAHNKGWTINRIADYCSLSPSQAFQIRRKVHLRKMREIEEAPAEILARHAVQCEEIYEAAMESFYELPLGQRDPTFLKVGLAAMSEERKAAHLEQTKKTINLNVSATAETLTDQEQAHIHDPELRRLKLAYQDRKRKLAEGPGDVPGRVRRNGERRALAGQAAPPADGRSGSWHRGRGDQQAVDQPTPADGKELVLVEVFPGLAAGELPGSEGDLG